MLSRCGNVRVQYVHVMLPRGQIASMLQNKVTYTVGSLGLESNGSTDVRERGKQPGTLDQHCH